jgi:STE24 endopeptidase
MTHLLIIALAVALFADEIVGGQLRLAGLGVGAAVAITLAAQAILSFGVLAWGAHCARRLRLTGRPVWIDRSQRGAGIARIAAVLVHVAAIFGLGWLDAIRALFGDWILIDEAVAIAPALVTFFASWLSFATIERMLWESSLVRSLDDGLPLRPARGRIAYASDQFRHGVAIILVPLAIIWTWNESVVVVAERAGFALDSDASRLALSAVQFVGVILAFTITPPLMVRVWRTVTLGSGALRSGLESMCARHGVRCRDIRVWQTDGAMLNGAVMGLFAPVRYILLTDALLESLPEEQVEAVAAHEIAHIKRRHLFWLLAALLAAIWFGGFVVMAPFDLVNNAFSLGLFDTPIDWAAQGAAAVLSIVAAVLVFGVVSRAFERQADAFAVQSLSGFESPSGGSASITPEATRAMAGALGSVARLNAIPAQRFFWRHGSIDGRRRRILALEGTPVRRTRADRAARVIKAATAAALGLMVCVEGWALVQSILFNSR